MRKFIFLLTVAIIVIGVAITNNIVDKNSSYKPVVTTNQINENITPSISTSTPEPSSTITTPEPIEWNKWVAMGTSITEDNIYMRDPSGVAVGTYIPYLSELMGVEAPDGNYSVSGAAFAGHLLYYIHDPIIQLYGKTIYGYSHIALKDADLITIEGSINDYHSSVPLGKVGDTVPYSNRESILSNPNSTNNYGGSKEGTFAGCIYTVIKTLKEINPRATIVFITDNAGTGICDANRKNQLGFLPHDYNDMMIEVAESMNCYAIDAGRNSGFEENLDTYLSDFLNHSEEGGKAYAETIYAGLEEIKESLQ